MNNEWGRSTNYKYIIKDKGAVEKLRSYIDFASQIWEESEAAGDYRGRAPLAVDLETYYPLVADKIMDIETDMAINKAGPSPHKDNIRLLSIRIGYVPMPVLIFDADKLSTDTMYGLIEEMLRWPVWIGHNIKYDLTFLMVKYQKVPAYKWLSIQYLDTMIFDQILAAEIVPDEKVRRSRPRNLAIVTKFWLDSDEITKEMQVSNWKMPILTARQLKYAAMDVNILHLILKAQMDSIDHTASFPWVLNSVLDVLKPKERPALYSQSWVYIESYFLSVLALTEARGLRVDKNWLVKEYRYHLSEFKKVGKEITDYTRTNKAVTTKESNDNELSLFGSQDMQQQVLINNPQSGQQIAAYLIACDYDLPLSDKGTPKTDKDTLSTVLGQNNEFFKLLEKQNSHKIISTKTKELLDKLNDLETEYLYPQFKQIAAPTGRMSATQPAIMNILPTIRNAFKSYDDTQILADYDFSQEELRIMAAYSSDTVMLNAYKAGKDLHRLTAAGLNGIAEESVTKSQRQAAKAANFGLIYGMGWKGFKQYALTSYGVDFSDEEAQEVRHRFFKTYPGVNRLVQAVFDRLEGEGPIVPDGFTHMYFKNGYMVVKSRTGRGMVSNRPNEILNYPIQGTGADVLKLSSILFMKALIDKDKNLPDIVHILNFIHDEILLSIPKDCVYITEILQQCMVKAGAALVPEIELLVEGTTGETWADIH